MKKILTKKTLAIALVLMSLLLCSVGVAAEDEIAAPVTVTVSSFSFAGKTYDPAESVCIPPMQMTVYADTAEYYNYPDQVDPAKGVSALDVFVALHEWYYADAEESFTKDMLAVADTGYVTKFWNKESSYFSFAVNGKAEASAETGYGLTISEMQVKTGDDIYFTEYKDITWEDGMDECVWFMDKDNNRVTSLRVPVGTTIELTLCSYDFMNYSHLSVDKILTEKDFSGNDILEPLAKATVWDCSVEKDAVSAETDENGKLSLKLDKAGRYCFTVDAAEDSVIAIFDTYLNVEVYEPQSYSAFSDLGDEWYKEPVTDVLEQGYMYGMEKGVFAPNDAVTREQFVTMLYRLNGSPLPAYGLDFKDVEEDRYSTEAIYWAGMVGVVVGYEDKTFRPEQIITREEMACMIDRYLSIFDIALRDDVKTDAYTDADKIQDWAVGSVETLTLGGILMGRDDGSFDPQGITTRAEAATVLSNLLDL